MALTYWPGLVRPGLFSAWCGVVWHGSAWLDLARRRDLAWCGSDGFVVVWLCGCVCGVCGQWLAALPCGVWVDRLWFAFRDTVTVKKQDMTVLFFGLTVLFLLFDRGSWPRVCGLTVVLGLRFVV